MTNTINATSTQRGEIRNLYGDFSQQMFYLQRQIFTKKVPIVLVAEDNDRRLCIESLTIHQHKILLFIWKAEILAGRVGQIFDLIFRRL